MYFLLKLLSIILVVLLYSSLTFCAIDCSNLIEILPKNKFATKTGYFNVKYNHTNYKQFIKQVKGCASHKVWFLSRHGTRYPIGEDYRILSLLPQLAKQIESNFNKGKEGCLSSYYINRLKKWIYPYNDRDKGELHSVGAAELYTMGIHWKTMFPSIFDANYDAEKIKIRFTTRNRTQQSAYHFLCGMYGNSAAGNIPLPDPSNPDYLLRFHKACPAWVNDVYRNKKTYYEQNQFEYTTLYKESILNISNRLGFKKPLSADYIAALYGECRFETAWFPKRESVWCMPFTEHDLEVLEFHQDLKYYYEDSYGIEMNIGMACYTINDLLTFFRNDGEQSLDACLYFSHDKVILHFLTSLGLFKPKNHLVHTNYDLNRIFRTSYITPFASNIGFVQYKCGGESKIATFMQGNPIQFDAVCKDFLCPSHLFENYLNNFLSNCNFSKTCMIHDEL